MPINVKDVMEKGTAVTPQQKGSNIEAVKQFLAQKESKDQFFSQKEITDAVSKMLGIEKKGPAIRSALLSIKKDFETKDKKLRLVCMRVPNKEGKVLQHWGFMNKDKAAALQDK